MVLARILCIVSAIIGFWSADARSFDSRLFSVAARHVHSSTPITLQTHAATNPLESIVTLRGGESNEELISEAYEWCTNLGAPAALVAGAVIATMYDNMNKGDLNLKESDAGWARICKKVTRLLLLSAFALEIISIFVTTVTGTMLMSRTDAMMAKSKIVDATTPLSFLRDNFEFEYLTSRFTFLQGLLNWIFAIGLNHFIPSGESKATARVNRFVGASLITTMLLMVSFLNTHLTFYHNYFLLVSRWISVTWDLYVWEWPIRPMAFAYGPAALLSLYWGYVAFVAPNETGDFEREKED